MIIGIVAVDNNWAIGKNNGLLYKLPKDMKRFKEITTGHIVACGYNTLLSFPNSKPLKDRTTIVLCPEDIERDDCVCVHNFNSFIKILECLSITNKVFIIGGAMLYKSMLPYYDQVLVTKVDAEDKEATAFFPNLDEDDRFTCYSTLENDVDNGYNTYLYKYEQNN